MIVVHVVVCVKHVHDTTELRLDPATGRPMLEYAPSKINDYDRNALEEGVRLKERSGAVVTVVSVGPREAAKTLKEALAAGADRALLVISPWPEAVDPAATARLLAAASRHVSPVDLILCGDLSEDGYTGLVPGMLAAVLDVPYLGGAVQLEVAEDAATVTRVADGLTETYRLQLPAVVSVARAINVARTVTTLQVVKVATSRITVLSAAEAGEDAALVGSQDPAARVVGSRPAASPRRNEILAGDLDAAVSRLAAALRDAGVLR